MLIVNTSNPKRDIKLEDLFCNKPKILNEWIFSRKNNSLNYQYLCYFTIAKKYNFGDVE